MTDPEAHLTLAGLAQQAGYAYDFAKAGSTAEAIEHLDAMERLISSYRAAIGVDRVLERRIYVDGEGDPWIEIPMSPDDGSVAIVQLREDTDVAAPAEEIRENTGGLREIGRCA